MAKKKRRPSKRGLAARDRTGVEPASAGPPSAAVQRGAQAAFFIAIAYVAAREGIGALHDPIRTEALWALAACGSLIGLMRRKDARITDDLCLSLSPRARGGVLFAVVACVVLALSNAGNRQHGLFGASTADAALIGCLVFAGAMLAWGGAASATRALVDRSLPSVFAGAVVFTMAFFTGNLYADAAVFVAAIAGTITSQRTRSFGFAAIVFAYGAGGIPAAVATTALYVAVSVARL